ncbi:hypothetical protein K431DRAFT_282826 [Polychaeton citri CBS 116435]|uniref:Uncharacterized protein n=1 Tax=Polychaeton citri CBS 116435 TaxID=1314669 RepID=A0A9P4URA9_9PEZI|nr:hypothetical protein K431DRAFT_282826 [Polychaeton citri CBS 116435]
MHSNILIALAIVPSVISAGNVLRRQLSDSAEDYLASICLPTSSTGEPDPNAPCNALYALELGCIYGPESAQGYLSNCEGASASGAYCSATDGSRQDNATQRACACESQLFPEYDACMLCYKAHGAGDDDFIPSSLMRSASSSYCAATASPTLGLAEYLYAVVTSAYPSYASTTPYSAEETFATFSDPIGNKTAVSYYFTPSVTGSVAYAVPAETNLSSLNTESGQIVPTASANNEAAVSHGGSTRTSTGSNSISTTASRGSQSGTTSGSAAAASDTGNAAMKIEMGALAGLAAVAAVAAAL